MDMTAEVARSKPKTSPARSATGQLLPGHTANANGRPKKGTSLAEIARSRSIEDKDAVVAKMYQQAKQGDVASANWILKAEGDTTERGQIMRELIVREYGFVVEDLD